MRPRRKVLICIDWFLPGYKAGGPIQSCANLIAHLKDQCEFWVITRDTDYCSDKPYSNVLPNAWNELDIGANVYYLSSSTLTVFTIHQLIKSVNPDILYINGVYSFYFSIVPIISAKLQKLCTIIVAGRGMFAAGSVNVKAEKKKFFFDVAKSIGLYKHVAFHATNEEEKEDIIAVLGYQHQICVAPNLPKLDGSSISAIRSKEVNELRLVSIARVSPEKNTKYALEILQAYEGAGDISFDIYGPIYNEPYWKECKAMIAAMPVGVKVRYCGSIPHEQVPDTLNHYHALLLPTRGENFGHTILESLATGCPVIISNKTPWRDLKNKGAGYDIALEDKDAFSKAIEAMLEMDESAYISLSKSTIKFALEQMAVPKAVEANKLLFNL